MFPEYSLFPATFSGEYSLLGTSLGVWEYWCVTKQPRNKNKLASGKSVTGGQTRCRTISCERTVTAASFAKRKSCKKNNNKSIANRPWRLTGRRQSPRTGDAGYGYTDKGYRYRVYAHGHVGQTELISAKIIRGPIVIVMTPIQLYIIGRGPRRLYLVRVDLFIIYHIYDVCAWHRTTYNPVN